MIFGFTSVIVSAAISTTIRFLQRWFRSSKIAVGANIVMAFAIMTLSLVGSADRVFAQSAAIRSLSERSAIIFLGKVVRTNVSDEPLLAPSNRTAVVRVIRMYAGREIASDQSGRSATVVLTRPGAVHSGDQVMIFGNPLFIGNELTVKDQGEVLQASPGPSAFFAQTQSSRPIEAQLKEASLVFRGTVTSIGQSPTVARVSGSSSPLNEHDPQLRSATVRITKPVEGGRLGQLVTLLFSASRDIMWFNSPKLHIAEDALFLAHTPGKEDRDLNRSPVFQAFSQKGRVYLVTQPFDVLPAADLALVRTMLMNLRLEHR